MAFFLVRFLVFHLLFYIYIFFGKMLEKDLILIFDSRRNQKLNGEKKILQTIKNSIILMKNSDELKT
jgi:hypothetical protein